MPPLKNQLEYAANHPLILLNIDLVPQHHLYSQMVSARVPCSPQIRCCDIRRETNLDLSARLGSGTRPATNPGYRMTLHYSHRRRERNSQHLDRKLPQEIGIALGRPCPIAVITEPRVSKFPPEIPYNLSGGVYGPSGFSYLHRN